MYDSVHKQLFELPDDYTVYPAHDYKGKFIMLLKCVYSVLYLGKNLWPVFVGKGLTCSTIEEEKKYNPRLTKTRDEFKTIMSNLNLPYPKMLDKALPANQVCGLYNLPDNFEPLTS